MYGLPRFQFTIEEPGVVAPDVRAESEDGADDDDCKLDPVRVDVEELADWEDTEADEVAAEDCAEDENIVEKPEVTLAVVAGAEVHEDVSGVLEAPEGVDDTPEDVDGITSRVLGVHSADVSEADVDRPVVVCDAELLREKVKLEVDDQEEDD
ncbi:hypothetical protein N0V94_006871 [Neodidymelliopsis sp. IMI 364377]|nr:hypothetical protein N0V94_006871 [Neodidymelliopsis sp. IMI 364377]